MQHYTIYLFDPHVWLLDGPDESTDLRDSTMSLLARNSSKCRRICFEVRVNLKIICLYKYSLYTYIIYICYINMQCTIMLESNSMFYHFSSDSTVCTSCLPSLSIDRCKSTRFPVVGQNLILGEIFVHSTWASCLFGWLLATFLY